MKSSLVITGDGSHTLYVPELEDHYHSTFGAVQESKYIFIEKGFQTFVNRNINCNILEVGFGTGLNAFLTLADCRKRKIRVNYHAVELWPVSLEVSQKLNYPEYLDIDSATEIFMTIHKSDWDKEISVNSLFTLKKMIGKIQDIQLPQEKYHIVFFDAFGPSAQPELWTREIFRKIFFAMKKGGVFLTFSVKGLVKRNLKEEGFQIEILPGPVGKRSITRAWRL